MGLGDNPGAPLKIGACTCLFMVLTIGLTFMSFYWGLYNTASAYDENAANTLSYDDCTRTPLTVDDIASKTCWTQVFKF